MLNLFVVFAGTSGAKLLFTSIFGIVIYVLLKSFMNNPGSDADLENIHCSSSESESDEYEIVEGEPSQLDSRIAERRKRISKRGPLAQKEALRSIKPVLFEPETSVEEILFKPAAFLDKDEYLRQMILVKNDKTLLSSLKEIVLSHKLVSLVRDEGAVGENVTQSCQLIVILNDATSSEFTIDILAGMIISLLAAHQYVIEPLLVSSADTSFQSQVRNVMQFDDKFDVRLILAVRLKTENKLDKKNDKISQMTFKYLKTKLTTK